MHKFNTVVRWLLAYSGYHENRRHGHRHIHGYAITRYVTVLLLGMTYALCAHASDNVVYTLKGLSRTYTTGHSGNNSTEVIIWNKTSRDFILADKGLVHGKWEESPPASIPAGAVGRMTASGVSVFIGSEGTIVYHYSNGEHINVYFDNPWIGVNRLRISMNSFLNRAEASFVVIDQQGNTKLVNAMPSGEHPGGWDTGREYSSDNHYETVGQHGEIAVILLAIGSEEALELGQSASRGDKCDAYENAAKGGFQTVTNNGRTAIDYQSGRIGQYLGAWLGGWIAGCTWSALN